MDWMEKIYLIMFTVTICIVAYSHYKCKKLSKLKPLPLKFKKGDYIQEIGLPGNIKQITGFYVTESGQSMTTVITHKVNGQQVELRNQSSQAYATVVINQYYKKIEYGE